MSLNDKLRLEATCEANLRAALVAAKALSVRDSNATAEICDLAVIRDVLLPGANLQPKHRVSAVQDALAAWKSARDSRLMMESLAESVAAAVQAMATNPAAIPPIAAAPVTAPPEPATTVGQAAKRPRIEGGPPGHSLGELKDIKPPFLMQFDAPPKAAEGAKPYPSFALAAADGNLTNLQTIKGESPSTGFLSQTTRLAHFYHNYVAVDSQLASISDAQIAAVTTSDVPGALSIVLAIKAAREATAAFGLEIQRQAWFLYLAGSRGWDAAEQMAAGTGQLPAWLNKQLEERKKLQVLEQQLTVVAETAKHLPKGGAGGRYQAYRDEDLRGGASRDGYGGGGRRERGDGNRDDGGGAVNRRRRRGGGGNPKGKP